MNMAETCRNDSCGSQFDDARTTARSQENHIQTRTHSPGSLEMEFGSGAPQVPPVSPSTRTRPACECKKPQTPSSSFKYLLRPWSRMKVKSELLQRGHGFPAAFMASIHSWQIFCPQGQLMTQGSFSTCRQMGHSVWKAAAGASTNSQSYPPRRLPPGGIGFGARTA